MNNILKTNEKLLLTFLFYLETGLTGRQTTQIYHTNHLIYEVTTETLTMRHILHHSHLDFP